MNITCRALSTLLLQVAVVAACMAVPADPPGLTVQPMSSGTDALLQAVSPVTDEVAWIGGHQATWLRTIDGGRTWEPGTVENVGDLEFRDIAAFDDMTAYLMSAGPGDRSRIFRTDDGGLSWRQQHVASDPAAFFDCMDFWSPERGLLYGDAIDGVPFLLRTDDGGASWTRVPAASLPPAPPGEGGFAASGTCLTTGPAGRAWVAMAVGDQPRMLMTDDYGLSWEVVNVPVDGGPTTGMTTVHVTPDGQGVALGGPIGGPDDGVPTTRNVAFTEDGGATWSEGGGLAMSGAAYGSSLVPGMPGGVVAVGPSGLDWSRDWGRSWLSSDTLSYWAVGFSSPSSGWAVGPGGRISKLSIRP